MTAPLADDFCPYRGLAHYDEDYAQFFVGRETDIAWWSPTCTPRR